MRTVMTCDACGTPHQAISRSEAERMIQMAKAMQEEGKDPPDIADLEHCSFCGNDHTGFSPGEGDPDGAWIIMEVSG